MRLLQNLKAFAIKIGEFQAGVILVVFYFTLFLVPGLAVALLMDVLQLKKQKESYWLPRKSEEQNLVDVERQW